MILSEIHRVSGPKIVYHGSMYEFDSFDMNKIGSENSDKGGWGIYVSESEDVARQYTPEGKEIIMKLYLPSGKFFDLDSLMDEHLFNELMESLEYYNETVFNKTESFREEINNYEFHDYELTGLQFYEILSHDFGSKKEMSLFLKDFGFRGNTLMDKTHPNVRNYVLFSTDGLKKV